MLMLKSILIILCLAILLWARTIPALLKLLVTSRLLYSWLGKFLEGHFGEVQNQYVRTSCIRLHDRPEATGEPRSGDPARSASYSLRPRFTQTFEKTLECDRMNELLMWRKGTPRAHGRSKKRPPLSGDETVEDTSVGRQTLSLANLNLLLILRQVAGSTFQSAIMGQNGQKQVGSAPTHTRCGRKRPVTRNRERTVVPEETYMSLPCSFRDKTRIDELQMATA